MADLFDFLPPAARAADPATSHAAAADVTASGVRSAQCARVLAGVRDYPGRTSRELAVLLGMDRHAVARRTADLEHAGKVRKGEARPCTAGGKPAVTWWLTNQELPR